jgi:hypothetical protein
MDSRTLIQSMSRPATRVVVIPDAPGDREKKAAADVRGDGDPGTRLRSIVSTARAAAIGPAGCHSPAPQDLAEVHVSVSELHVRRGRPTIPSPAPEQVNLHEAELRRHGKAHEFHRYDGAGHGVGGRLKITNRR